MLNQENDLTCFVVFTLIESLSFQLQLKTFLRLFIGFMEAGIRWDWIRCSPSLKQNMSVTLPFLRTKDLDFACLRLLCAHAMILSRSVFDFRLWTKGLQNKFDFCIRFRKCGCCVFLSFGAPDGSICESTQQLC